MTARRPYIGSSPLGAPDDHHRDHAADALGRLTGHALVARQEAKTRACRTAIGALRAAAYAHGQLAAHIGSLPAEQRDALDLTTTWATSFVEETRQLVTDRCARGGQPSRTRRR